MTKSSDGVRKIALAEHYDRLYDGEPLPQNGIVIHGWPRNRHEALLFLARQSKGRVLDVGCGNGSVLYYLRQYFDELCGVELSALRADSARRLLQRTDARFDIRSGNIEEGLEWPDNYFDVIVSADVIEHVVDIWSAAAEMARLIRPGGTLICSTPNIAYLPRRLALLMGRFPSTAGDDEGFSVRDGELYDGGHLHYFTYSTLERLFARNGVEIIRRFGFGRLGRLHNLCPQLLSGAVCIVGKKL